MAATNPVVIEQQPTQVTLATREELSKEIAAQNWAQLARQVPDNERIVIRQDTQNTYTIERQRLPDPNAIPVKQSTTWSGIILLCGIAVSAVFMVSMYLRYGGG